MDTTTLLGVPFAIPDYSAFTPADWLAYALCGVAGWIAWTVYDRGGRFLLPKVRDGAWCSGSLGDLAVALTAATLADHNYLFATIAATGAPVIIKLIMQGIPAAVCRALGLPVKEK